LVGKILKLYNDVFKTINTNNSLKAKATRGTIWLVIGNGADRALRLIRNMILARLLAPEAFGLMAIILAINQAFESFTEVGISKAIIQNQKGQEKEFLNGAWWFSVCRSIILYATGFIGAPFIADFYNNPHLISMVRIAFLTILFNGSMSPMAHVAVKNMNYKRWVIIAQGGGVIGISTSIILALIYPGVWALVIGFIIEAFVRCIMSFIICPFKPGLSFDKEGLRSLLKFARGVLGLPILTYIFMRADVFVVGKLCTTSKLGLYSMAYALVQVPFQTITAIMNQILLPIFSKKQNDKNWINQMVLDITAAIAFFSFPLFSIVVLYGGDLLRIIYGAQYAQVAIAFTILFASAMIRACGIPIVQVYFSQGRPELHRNFTAIRALLTVIIIIPAVKSFGLIGAASAGLISYVIGFIFQLIILVKFTQLNLKKYGLIFIHSLMIAVFVLIVWFIMHNLLLSNPLFGIFSAISGCLLAYRIALYIFFKYKNSTSLNTTLNEI